MALDQIAPIMEFLLEVLDTDDKKHLWKEGRREERKCDQFLSLENPYWTPEKCSMKLVVPAVLGLPRAAGSITALSGFCL